MPTKSKAKAFTLAEVLITLGIIGIVAALTIPTIINSSDKQEYLSRFKENYSIFSQATTQLNNDCGGSATDCLATPNAANDDATTRLDFLNLYKAKLSIAKDCTTGTTGCFVNANYKNLSGTDSGMNFEAGYWVGNARMQLSNGASVGVRWITNDPGIIIDVNGPKGPNQWGKDLFYFAFNPNTKTFHANYGDNDCGAGSNNGVGCSGKVVKENAINYY